MSRRPPARPLSGRSVCALVAACAACAALGGCRISTEERHRIVSRDQGTICIGASVEGDGGAAFGVDLHEGQPLPIAVRTGCLSNGCATQRTAKCSVKRDGAKLVVNSELSWYGPEDIGYKCPEQCTPLEARCISDALPAGKYQIVLGRQTVDVAVPSHRDATCVTEAPRIPPKLPPPAVSASATAPPATAPIAARPVDPNVTPAAPGTGVPAEPPESDKICIAPGSVQKNRALRVGQPVSITVLHANKCIGAACSGAPAKCTVKRHGKRLVLTAQFPSVTTKPRLPCTDDCKPLVATCRTDGLPAGVYTIEHGEQRASIQIPLANAPDCN